MVHSQFDFCLFLGGYTDTKKIKQEGQQIACFDGQIIMCCIAHDLSYFGIDNMVFQNYTDLLVKIHICSKK